MRGRGGMDQGKEVMAVAINLVNGKEGVVGSHAEEAVVAVAAGVGKGTEGGGRSSAATASPRTSARRPRELGGRRSKSYHQCHRKRVNNR